MNFKLDFRIQWCWILVWHVSRIKKTTPYECAWKLRLSRPSVLCDLWLHNPYFVKVSWRGGVKWSRNPKICPHSLCMAPNEVARRWTTWWGLFGQKIGSQEYVTPKKIINNSGTNWNVQTHGFLWVVHHRSVSRSLLVVLTLQFSVLNNKSKLRKDPSVPSKLNDFYHTVLLSQWGKFNEDRNFW